MEGKKISFGFMKTKKAEKPVVEEKKDFIECVEEKSIKVVGGEQVEEVKPLVIPLKPNTLITAERLKQIAEKVESALEEPEKKEIKIEPVETVENETLDQMAVRELIAEVKNEIKVEKPTLTVPIPVATTDKESTLEDYEAVPIQDFGLAMLRGMGWAPGKEQAKYKQPELRPKGLGLGADKVVKANQKKKVTKDKEEELAIVPNSFVKITTGKYSGYYGKVLSLDEDMGRVLVDITVKKETVSLSEFMMQPVAKTEYDRESKVINADSYEQYKKKEHAENLRNDSAKVSTSSNQRSEQNERRAKERREENNRRDYHDSANGRKKEETRTRDSSSSVERDRQKRKDDRNRRDSASSEERSRQKKKDKRKRRSSSSSDDGSRQKKKDERKRRDESSSEERNSRVRKEERKKRDSSSSVERSRQRRKEKKKRSRHSSTSPEKIKKHGSKKRCSSDLSDSDEKEQRRKSPLPEAKRDIDKKRKGKKKKRDRDRSPHYKKHRK